MIFKLAVTVHRCLNGRAPAPYLSDYCDPVAGADTRRHLRSTNRQLAYKAYKNGANFWATLYNTLIATNALPVRQRSNYEELPPIDDINKQRETTRTYTKTLLGGLIESVSRSTTHRATTGERTDRVLTGLTLDARVLVQRTLVYVYVTHTHIVVTSRTHISDVIPTACC